MKESRLLSKTFCILVCMILVAGVSMYARVFGNGSSCVYCDPEPESIYETTPPCQNYIMSAYIEASASYFLNSYSNFLKVLVNLELTDQQGFDKDNMLSLLNSSKSELESAIQLYSQIIQIAEATPYNQTVIADLQTFDYKAFGKTNTLDEVIFKKVQSYLENGDVTGAYIWLKDKMVVILSDMNVLSNIVDRGDLPQTSNFWTLNRQYSQVLSFGQYIAEVFYAIVCIE